MAKKTRSKKREAARKKRSQRGWSTRANRSPEDPPEEGDALSASAEVPAVPLVDAPAPPSFLERMPWWARWAILVAVSVIIGILAGANYTVQLGLTAGVATLLAGGAFLAALLPPTLRERPGDSAAVGFGRATGHERPDPGDADDAPTANRAARRRARREGAE